MPPSTTSEQVELSRLTVERDLADRLARLVERTGASGAWHRRKALAAYLAEQGA